MKGAARRVRDSARDLWSVESTLNQNIQTGNHTRNNSYFIVTKEIRTIFSVLSGNSVQGGA